LRGKLARNARRPCSGRRGGVHLGVVSPGQSFAFTGFLHLVIVVLAAVYGGFWQATFVSVVAATCLNYFFVPPIFSFVNSPANWVALGAFEFTALVISRLSLRARLQAIEAIARRREMERLYETSRRILLLDSRGESGNLITSLIREMFDLKAVRCSTLYRGPHIKAARCRRRRAAARGMRISWRRIVRSGDRHLVLCPAPGHAGGGRYGAARYADDQTGGHGTGFVERRGIGTRARLRREARAEAARQTEQLRTAVLDALAHQFKTPLTVARTASSGLLAVGGLSELQTELVTVIDEQARTLDHLASRLLSAAMLDSTEFKPKREPVLVSSLIRAAIERLDQETDRERFRVSVPNPELPILADRELILTSIAQLIDNAIKYSEPGSPIEVACTAKEGGVVLTVRNKGLVIAQQDRERVFERFYRAPETQHLPSGTGLGLSIVKKIVASHHGSVWAEGEAGYGTSFSMSLPAQEAHIQ
jgi:two-component system, OmpR family, sensor histidine kinase KdpD